MKLPKGITGYGTIEELAIHPIADMDFKRICYAVSQVLKAKLIECKLSFDMFSNHYYAIFQLREQVITVLYVPTHAYMAFSYGGKFIDNSDLAEAFMSLGDFHILTKEILEDYPKAEYLTELGEYEIKEIKRLNIKRLGEIIFNNWD